MGTQADGPVNGRGSHWWYGRIEDDIKSLETKLDGLPDRYVSKEDLTNALQPIRDTLKEMKDRQRSLSTQLLGALLMFAVSLLVGVALFVIERAGG